MVDISDYRSLKEKDFFILDCVNEKPQRIGEIARQHLTFLTHHLLANVNRLERNGYIIKNKDVSNRFITITQKGKDNLEYKKMCEATYGT